FTGWPAGLLPACHTGNRRQPPVSATAAGHSLANRSHPYLRTHTADSPSAVLTRRSRHRLHLFWKNAGASALDAGINNVTALAESDVLSPDSCRAVQSLPRW